MDSLKEFIKSLSPDGQKAFEGMSKKDKGVFEDILEGGKKMGEKVSAGAKTAVTSLGEALDKLVKPTIEVDHAMNALFNSSRQFQTEFQEFFKAGYTGQMFDFSDAISKANEASLKLNGSLDAGKEVATAFRDNTFAIAVASKDLTTSLMDAGVAMQGAGFNMDSFAQIVDNAAFAFNQNDAQIKGLTATLINAQKEIAVSGEELSTNFKHAQENFAYSADKMMDTFIDLQKMSKTTGVGFEALATSFGSNLDTFEGSAEMAGKLNQILGKSAFNSMELLTMTESERAKTVRNAITESGRSIEDMGKFEILALSKTLGMSVADTRKYLRGDLKIDQTDAMKKIEAADPNTIKQRQLGDTLDGLRSGIQRSRPAMDQFAVEMSNVSVTAAKMVMEQSSHVKKMQGIGLGLDQIIAGFPDVARGATTGRIDRTSVTGMGRKTVSDFTVGMSKLTETLPPAQKAMADMALSVGDLSNPKTAAALALAGKTFQDVFTNEKLEKLKTALAAGDKTVTVVIKNMLGQELGTAPIQ